MIEDSGQEWDINQKENDDQFYSNSYPDVLVAEPAYLGIVSCFCSAGKNVANLGGYNAGMVDRVGDGVSGKQTHR